jgi:hypothetical protein
MNVRFQVLTAASMKMAVFWVVALCSLVEVYRYLHHQGDEWAAREESDWFPCHKKSPRERLTHRPEDGGSNNLWHVSKLLSDCTAQQLVRQPSWWWMWPHRYHLPNEKQLGDNKISGSHGSKYEDDCLPGWAIIEVVSISETSVNFYQTTLRNIPEDSYL